VAVRCVLCRHGWSVTAPRFVVYICYLRASARLVLVCQVCYPRIDVVVVMLSVGMQDGSPYDLLVLKELVVHMSGIEVHDMLSAGHVEAMMGGETLQTEVRMVKPL